jgi:hypothetical protein
MTWAFFLLNSCQLEPLLDALVVPELRPSYQTHLCANKGYKGVPANDIICTRNYIPHVPLPDEDRTIILNVPDHWPRRWIVEVTHSWFKRFRKLFVRFKKMANSFIALLHLAAAVICWRKVGVIYGKYIDVINSEFVSKPGR